MHVLQKQLLDKNQGAIEGPEACAQGFSKVENKLETCRDYQGLS